jgi:hypothetical protein
VALRPRLSPGVPLSMAGWPEIRCGTGVIKCGAESPAARVRDRLGLLGNLRRGVSSSVGTVQRAGLVGPNSL